MMCIGVVVLLVGMRAGIAMGIQQDFAPAHAHLDLVGGVLLFLFGLYYLFPAGVAVVVLKGTSFIAAPVVGSLMAVAAMALFVVIVFRTSRA